MSQMEFKITGMVCAACSAAVTRVVTALPGVSGADVDHAGGTATVTYEGSVDAEAICEAILDAGFDVQSSAAAG